MLPHALKAGGLHSLTALSGNPVNEPQRGFFDPFGGLDQMMNMFGEMGPDPFKEFMKNSGNGQRIEKFFQSFGDGNDVTSNSVQITEENGKTKLKIDSKNSDMTYVIDGKKAPKDNVQMPEKIVNVNITCKSTRSVS